MICYSNDGLTWSGIGATIFTTSGNGIGWNNERWVAGGFGGSPIAYSTDGITWTSVATSTSIFSSGGNDVLWDGRRWIIVGEGTANTVATSSFSISFPIVIFYLAFTISTGLMFVYKAKCFQLFGSSVTSNFGLNF